jgi:putative tryptophan/tyrosine transport system substrate-binding protein
MKRRQFIALIGGTAAWPFAAIAQLPSKIWRIGFLAGGARPTNLESTTYGAFLRGMRELGYAENQILSLSGASPKADLSFCPLWPKNSFDRM